MQTEPYLFYNSTGDPALTAKLKAFPHVFPMDFIEDMHECMADCAIMISRAGATSVAEMVNFQIPSLIIPWSKAAENHQLRNAQALFQQGGALYLEEKETTAEAILDKLGELLDTNRQAEMRQALKKMQPEQDPTESIYSTILKDLIP